MSDYISREAAIEAIKDFAKYAIDEGRRSLDTVDDIVRLCDDIRKISKAADVAPVRHGRWINFYGDYRTAECSFCESLNEVTFDEESNGAFFDGFKHFYNYCPNCGAKMTEDNDEQKG